MGRLGEGRRARLGYAASARVLHARPRRHAQHRVVEHLLRARARPHSGEHIDGLSCRWGLAFPAFDRARLARLRTEAVVRRALTVALRRWGGLADVYSPIVVHCDGVLVAVARAVAEHALLGRLP